MDQAKLEDLELFALGHTDEAIASAGKATSVGKYLQGLVAERRGDEPGVAEACAALEEGHARNGKLFGILDSRRALAVSTASEGGLAALTDKMSLRFRDEPPAGVTRGNDELSSLPTSLNPATAFADLLPTRRQVTSASTEGQVAWFLACVAAEDNSESTRKTMAQLLSSIAPFLPFEVVKTFIMASVNDDRLRNVSMADVYEILTQEELVQLRFALATAGMPAANAATLIDALAAKITAKYSKAVQDNGGLPVDAQLDELQELADTLPDNYEWQTTVLYNRLLRIEATTGSLATDMPLLQRFLSALEAWIGSFDRHDGDRSMPSQDLHASSYQLSSPNRTIIGRALTDVVRAGGATSLFEGHLDGDETVLLAQVACGRDPDGNAIAMLAALRDSAFVKNLEERVVIQLAHSDYRKRFRPRDLVSLNLEIKNVEELVINIYELDSTQDVDAPSLDLNGLRPNITRRVAYTTSPSVVHVEEIAFPELGAPGVVRRGKWVIDLVGNGYTSRALITKGWLRLSSRVTAEGHLLRVLDEDNQPLTSAHGAKVVVSGLQHEFVPDDDGAVLVPFGEDERHRVVTMSCAVDADSQAGEGAGAGAGEGAGAGSAATGGDESFSWVFSSTADFTHMTGDYSFSAEIYIPREDLVSGNPKARLVVRPTLVLQALDAPVDLGLLQNVSLVVSTTDHKGNANSHTLEGVELSYQSDFVHAFGVPDNLRRVEVVLSGTTKSFTGKTQSHSASKVVVVNSQSDSTQLATMFLQRHAEGYSLVLLGRTGEPIADTVVNVSLYHKYVDTCRNAGRFRSDTDGRVSLGDLASHGFTRVTADANGMSLSETIHPLRSRSAPFSLVGSVEDEVQFSLATDLTEADVARARLFHVSSAGVVLSDQSSRLAVDKDGILTASGLSAGDYQLFVKDESAYTVHEVVVHQSSLGTRPHRAVNVSAAIDAVGGNLNITARGSSRVRVHVVPSHFVSTNGHLIDTFGVQAWDENVWVASSDDRAATITFLSGRRLSDEQRYILDRQGRSRPGNTLPRPSLLIAPWAVATTTTTIQKGHAGTSYNHDLRDEGASGGRRSHGEKKKKKRKHKHAAHHHGRNSAASRSSKDPCLDFLSTTLRPMYNIAVRGDGTTTLPLAAFAGASTLQVIVVDYGAVAATEVPLPRAPLPCRDLALSKPLDVEQHLVLQKEVAVVLPGQSCTVIRSAAAHAMFNSFGGAFDLMVDMAGGAVASSLRQWSWLKRWPLLPHADKLAKYGEFASHELNLFLKFKDPSFFDDVVVPFVRGKRQKTFVDHYIAGNDLAPFAMPARFSTLNAAEQALMVGSVAGVGPEYFQDTVSARPTSAAELDRLFNTAAAAGAVEALAEHATEESRRQCFDSSDECDDDDDDDCDFSEASDTSDLCEAKVDYSSSRRKAPAAFQKTGLTKEYAETHYYNATRPHIAMNEYWRDVAVYTATATPGAGAGAGAGGGPFVSQYFGLATSSFASAVIALAVLDLPFTAEAPASEDVDQITRRLTAGDSAFILFHSKMSDVTAPTRSSVLVVQKYVDPDDRFRVVEGGEQAEKYIDPPEFLPGKVYSCQIVVTNVSGGPVTAEIHFQIPQGSVPVCNEALETRRARIGLFQTHRTTYSFYFPRLGTFQHYPVHVTCKSALVAFAAPTTATVVRTPTTEDLSSWKFVSSRGSHDHVVGYLREQNLQPGSGVRLADIAWRMRDKEVCRQVLGVLVERRIWDDRLFAYALLHNLPEYAAMYFQSPTGAGQQYLSRCGPAGSFALASWGGEVGVGALRDAASFHTDSAYEHKEYDPVVNARAFQLGDSRQIMNRSISAQYRRLLWCMAHNPTLSDMDRIAVVYHMLLQDRVEDATKLFATVTAPAASATRITAVPGREGSDTVWSAMHYDYLAAYLDFFNDEPALARAVAEKYADVTVTGWRKKFEAIAAQLREMDGGETEVDPATATRDERMHAAARKDPYLSASVDGASIVLSYCNLSAVTLRFFEVDIEPLFSTTPFAVEQGGGSQSADTPHIRPHAVRKVNVPASADDSVVTHAVDIPDEYLGSNIMIEALSGALRCSTSRFATNMHVSVRANHGEVKVTNAATGRPLSRVYVKVFNRTSPGDKGTFYKDGHTDLRGVFDYVSLNTDQLASTERFALLVVSDGGAVVKQAAPPS